MFLSGNYICAIYLFIFMTLPSKGLAVGSMYLPMPWYQIFKKIKTVIARLTQQEHRENEMTQSFSLIKSLDQTFVSQGRRVGIGSTARQISIGIWPYFWFQVLFEVKIFSSALGFGYMTCGFVLLSLKDNSLFYQKEDKVGFELVLSWSSGYNDSRPLENPLNLETQAL